VRESQVPNSIYTNSLQQIKSEGVEDLAVEDGSEFFVSYFFVAITHVILGWGGWAGVGFFISLYIVYVIYHRLGNNWQNQYTNSCNLLRRNNLQQIYSLTIYVYVLYWVQ